MRSLLDRRAAGTSDAARLAARLAHFVAEHRRVSEATAAFRRADSGALGELSAASQRDAERLLGNQISETVALAAAAREAGALAASSFGAGFGGSVWALIEHNDEPAAFAARWRERYVHACPHVDQVEWFVARPGPGAFEVASLPTRRPAAGP